MSTCSSSKRARAPSRSDSSAQASAERYSPWVDGGATETGTDRGVAFPGGIRGDEVDGPRGRYREGHAEVAVLVDLDRLLLGGEVDPFVHAAGEVSSSPMPIRSGVGTSSTGGVSSTPKVMDHVSIPKTAFGTSTDSS